MKSLNRIMNRISQEEWSEIKRLSRSNSFKLSGMEWWNNKCYEKNKNESETDGCKEQISKWGEKEIPYERDIFKPSLSRFGLGSQPVAYFSNDFALNCCEVIDQFRNPEDLPWSELKKYLNGKTSLNPELMWYPITVKIVHDALILDLMDDSLSFLEISANNGRMEIKKRLNGRSHS